MNRFPSSFVAWMRRLKRPTGAMWLAVGLTGQLAASAGAQEPTNVNMVVTNDAIVEWVWATQVMFMAESGGNGVIDGDSNGWYGLGGSVTVTAVPHAYHHFAGWTGETQASASNAVLTLTLDQARAVTAQFAENRATNGAPEWWLAQYGWTNNFDVAAMDDQDHDGMFTWAEFIAGTSPTKSNECFKIESLAELADDGPVVICWDSVTGRSYTVYLATNLLSSWTNVYAVPGDGTIKCYTNADAGEGSRFFLLGVRKVE